MGEQGTSGRGLNSTRSGRLLAFGSTGFALAVTVLMTLAPASAGASVHPAVVLIAPYKGTVSSPSTYTSTGGCAALKSIGAKWAPTTGTITASVSSKAATCGKSIGYVGGQSYADAGPSVSVAIPFKVGSNGNHSIGATFTVTMASASTFAAPFCKLNVNYAPAKYQYSYGYCEAGAYLAMYANAQLIDLNNASYGAYNYSYVDIYNDSYTENYSDCYNYGTPTCYNSNGSHSYSGAYSNNAPGVAGYKMNGAVTFTMWTNGTMMVKGHHYALIFSLSLSCDSFAEKYNVIGLWSGSSSASVNMGSLGNGAVLKSVSIA